jgi:hypothetical protein
MTLRKDHAQLRSHPNRNAKVQNRNARVENPGSTRRHRQPRNLETNDGETA